MAIIMQALSLMTSLILLMSVSVNTVFAQDRIRIATAGGLSIVPVWVMQDKGLLKKRGVVAEIAAACGLKDGQYLIGDIYVVLRFTKARS